MIDTIRAYILLHVLGLTEADIISLLIDRAEYKFTNERGNTVIKGGKALPFNFEISGTKLWIYGSLCKYYHGDNLQTLTYRETCEAIVRLIEDTELPIHLFKVTRLDISINVLLNEPTSNYIKMFEEYNKYKKVNYYEDYEECGVYYKQKKRKTVLYDKYLEHTKNNKKNKKRRNNTVNIQREIEPVLDEYFEENGKNVFRYEHRILKTVRENFDRDEFLFRDLMRRSVWNQMVRIGYVHFLKLPWRNTISRLPVNVKGTKELERILLRCGVEYMGGIHSVLKMIENGSKNKLYDNYQQPHRLKKKIEEIDCLTDIGVLANKELYLELREKITIGASQNIVRKKHANFDLK